MLNFEDETQSHNSIFEDNGWNLTLILYIWNRSELKQKEQISSIQAEEPLKIDNTHSAIQIGPCLSFQFIDF